MISVTDKARDQVLAAFESQGTGKVALRLEARTNGTSEFTYGMRLVGPEDKSSEDLVVDGGGFEILLDPGSSKNLTGATIDYEEGVLKSGFKIDNPNQPEIPSIGEGPRGDLTGKTADKVERLIHTEINPAVASHGGQVHFLGVKDHKVYLSFGGGCHGCGMVDVTLKQGIEARIKELIPEIEEVVDVTDHSSGDNPYYV
ncbi:MAG: iron-sulfur cluster assembly accessory protein [Acidobacteriota bacterium]